MTSTADEIRKALFLMADPAYKKFQAALMPTVDEETIIGVRTPALRAYAKQLATTDKAQAFLSSLPHRYYEENNLHAALLEHCRDFDLALAEVNAFLPYLDNWATCDGFCPKILRKHPDRLLDEIKTWLCDQHPYTVRYGLVRLTMWFLDDPLFSQDLLRLAAEVEHPDYYVQMAQAWLFSFALIKQYRATLPFLLDNRLPTFIHNKAIQKAVESYRVAPETKCYLKTLKRKGD